MSQAKVAVVVGVGPGLGETVAHRFACEGFSIGLMARNVDKLSQIQKDIEANGGKALAVGYDVSDRDSQTSCC